MTSSYSSKNSPKFGFDTGVSGSSSPSSPCCWSKNSPKLGLLSSIISSSLCSLSKNSPKLSLGSSSTFSGFAPILFYAQYVNLSPPESNVYLRFPDYFILVRNPFLRLSITCITSFYPSLFTILIPKVAKQSCLLHKKGRLR